MCTRSLLVLVLPSDVCQTRGQPFRLAGAAVAEQREFEGGLKKRKREFGETLERYEAEVDKYAQRSELSKRDEVAAQVTDLSQKLKEVSLLTRAYSGCNLLQVSKLQLASRKIGCFWLLLFVCAPSCLPLFWKPAELLCATMRTYCICPQTRLTRTEHGALNGPAQAQLKLCHQAPGRLTVSPPGEVLQPSTVVKPCNHQQCSCPLFYSGHCTQQARQAEDCCLACRLLLTQTRSICKRSCLGWLAPSMVRSAA